MSAITAKASRKMKKYAVVTREPRCFLGSFDFSWEQRKFEEIAVRSSVICSDDTLPRVEYEDIVSGTGRLNKDIYAKQSIKSGIAFHQGDVLYGKLRPYLQNWLLPTFDGLAVGDFWVLQPQNADSSFLYRLIQSRQFDEVANQSTGTKMPRADWKLVSKTVFSIPSNISEQAAIGTYFTALDSLITLHQRKCALLFSPFQALISMMFTTSTFSWEQRKLGEMGQTYTGLSGKTKDDFGHGQARFVTYMNVFSNPISNPEMTEPIEIDPKQNEVEVGDVFFTTSSETPEEVGMSSILLEKRGKTYLNSFCFGFRPSEKIDSYYLAYMLRSESTRAKIILLAQGISRYNISKNKVMEIAVSLPSLDEQKMIGQYFSQLDNLITLHQRKCISFTGRAGRLISTVNKKRITSSWEQRKLSDLIIEYKETVDSDCTLPVLTSSKTEGVVLQEEHFGRVQNHDITGYNILPRNYCTYRNRSDGVDFTFNINRCCDKGIISKFYPVFYGNNSDIFFISMVLNYCDEVVREIAYTCTGTGQKVLSFLDLQKMNIRVPSYDEQKKISQYFEQLDNLITLHQRKPFLMKWRNSDANRNQTNRLVL